MRNAQQQPTREKHQAIGEESESCWWGDVVFEVSVCVCVCVCQKWVPLEVMAGHKIS